MGIMSALGGALGGIPGGGTVGRMLGISGTKGDQLPEDAAKAIEQSNANAQQAYLLALQQAAAAGQIQAPAPISATNVGVPTITAATADPNLIVNTTDPRVLAYQAAAAQKADATLATATDATGRMTGYDAALAEASRARAANAAISDVNTDITAPTMAPAAQTAAIDVGGADVGYAGINQIATDTRDESLAAARSIASGPSAAMSQFESGMDEATSQALSVANRARGSDRAGARREAIIQLGQQGAKAAEAAAATAAQEETAKRLAYAQTLQGVRGADVTVAQTQAQIDAQRAQQQAQIDAQREITQANLNAAIAQGNTAAINELTKQKSQLDLAAQTESVRAGLTQQSTQAGVNVSNAQLLNAAEIQKAQLETAVSTSNAEAKTKAAADLAAAKNLASQQYAAANTGVSQTNAAAQTKAAADYAAAVNARNSEYAQAQTAASTQNAQIAAQRAEGNAQRGAQVATADASNKTSAAVSQGQAALQAGTTNAGNALDASKTNSANYLDTEKLKQSGTTSAISGINQSASTQGSNAGAVVGAQAKAAEAQAKQDASLIGAASTAAMMSDERTKEDIDRPSDAELDDLARKIEAYTWRRKPGYPDSGVERAGPMAQDLEKSRLGKKLVHEDQNGSKYIDVLSLAGLLAAAAARSMRKNREERT